MTDDPRQMTDPRETTHGPGSSKLAAEGNEAQEPEAGKPQGSDDTSRNTEAGTAGQRASEGDEKKPKAEEPRSRFGGRAGIAAATGLAVGLAGAIAARARARRRRALLAKAPFSRVRRVFVSR